MAAGNARFPGKAFWTVNSRTFERDHRTRELRRTIECDVVSSIELDESTIRERLHHAFRDLG
jgi:hypothetical protein